MSIILRCSLATFHICSIFSFDSIRPQQYSWQRHAKRRTRPSAWIFTRDIDAPMLSLRYFGTSSLISRRNLILDIPQVCSISTPATSGWRFSDGSRMCSRLSIVCCSAVFSYLKSGNLLRMRIILFLGLPCHRHVIHVQTLLP